MSMTPDCVSGPAAAMAAGPLQPSPALDTEQERALVKQAALERKINLPMLLDSQGAVGAVAIASKGRPMSSSIRWESFATGSWDTGLDQSWKQ